MGIAIAIVIGATVVLGTGMAGLFDFLGKRAGGGGKELQTRLAALEQRLAEQDQSAADREEQLRRLQGEVAFMTRLLEGKTGQTAGTPPAGA